MGTLIKKLKILISFILLFYLNFGYAINCITKKIPQFANPKVNVWKTIIYPTVNSSLKMHRHEHDRVVVALTDGKLKITNNLGKKHYLLLKKGESYYLEKDPINELHMDQNMTNHPVSVVVVEIK